MAQNFNRGGRPPKINPAVFRYVVRLDARENEVFLSMFEKTGALNKAAFIKSILFNTPFKVFYMDENTREFIDKLSSLNSLYRTVGIEYGIVVKASSLLVTTGAIWCKILKSRSLSGDFFHAHTAI